MANGTVKHIRHIDGVPLVDTSLPAVCAFVPQQPWLQSGTIRRNVIFDQQGDVDESRYRAVLRACCLDADIARMPAGDATEVGDGGSNLSGGQRQRVSLARAAYSAAPLVLLDDVLSALDPAVASEVFSRCILRLMAGRTRVLVTHSELIADHADAVYSLKDGAMARSEVGRDGGDTTSFAAQPDNDVIPTSTGLAEVLGHSDDGVGGNRGMRQFISQLAASVGGPRFFSCITVAFLLEMAVVEVGVLYLTEFA
jgi:ABC-type multidrug transport system ATPase subunit